MPQDNSRDEPGQTDQSSSAQTKDAASDETVHELLNHPSHEELLKKLTETEQKMNEYWDRIIRMQAEADNQARRHERDVGSAHKYALEKFAIELLPIIDSLELCLNNIPEEMDKKAHTVVEGVRLTVKMFHSAIERFGIQQVNPVSEPFNPEYHQAISMQVDKNLAPNTVISVLQKGYTLNQRLLRPALVVVVKSDT